MVRLQRILAASVSIVLPASSAAAPEVIASSPTYPSNGVPIARDVPLIAGRNTLWMAVLFPEVAGQRFSVRIASLDRPGGAAPLTVEKAIYSRWFGAGAASLATRLPDLVPRPEGSL